MPDACVDKPRASAPVLRLVPRAPEKSVPPPAAATDDPRHRQMLDMLERLLTEAKAGNVTGVAFVASIRERGYIADVAGEMQRHPTWARGALRTLDDKLARINWR